jgi:hypothetical protein
MGLPEADTDDNEMTMSHYIHTTVFKDINTIFAFKGTKG